LGTTPTLRVASRSTTASGPPARANSTPAATRPARTSPRARRRRGAASSMRIRISMWTPSTCSRQRPTSSGAEEEMQGAVGRQTAERSQGPEREGYVDHSRTVEVNPEPEVLPVLTGQLVQWQVELDAGDRLGLDRQRPGDEAVVDQGEVD